MSMNDTELRLEAALQRLLKGKPLFTKRDGKINVSRINDEAQLSPRNIYYYRGFLERAQEAIQAYNKQNESHSNSRNESHEESFNNLRARAKKAESLKNKYRNERDSMKASLNLIIKENVSLAFHILELEDENRCLTIEKSKVIGLKERQK